LARRRWAREQVTREKRGTVRTLIAGFGNVLRGDDGFGVEVLRRLGGRGIASESVELLDVGTGGIRLAQELLGSYDRLIILDATTRGGAPGTLYTLTIDDVVAARDIDMHTTIPSSALAVAKALGTLPPEMYLVGCEPAEVDDFSIGLSPVVEAAADVAVQRVEELMMRKATAGEVIDASEVREARLARGGEQ
jgi:hydrogenase maturation protease